MEARRHGGRSCSPRVPAWYHRRMKPLSNLSLISAMSDNGVIGRNNGLPWRLPADLTHFKRLTMGKPIIMGRRTWESLPGLLPHRTHIVLTRDHDYRAEGAQLVHSLADAIALANDVEEFFVVGGENLYRQALPLASRMYLTYVHEHVDGDASFPEYEQAEWCERSRQRHEADVRNAMAYTFVTLERC